MGLMFPRIARNFAKAGYFPTDPATLQRCTSAFETAGPRVRIIDPCAGEGKALAEVRARCINQGTEADTYGVEIDAERAWHAKGLLDQVAHADLNDVLIGSGAFGLLWLNPPYGNSVADKARIGDRPSTDRLEKMFCRRTFGLLQPGGVLVLIVPPVVYDEELSTFVARHFERVSIWRAPEQRFRQTVLFGVKRKPAHPSAELVRKLIAIGVGDLDIPELPESWGDQSYTVPMASSDVPNFRVIPLDLRQLDVELSAASGATLWPRFASIFAKDGRVARRPLRRLSKWHLALALAAGQICGMVRSPGGRELLIKGDTFKDKLQSTESSFDENGTMRETRVLTDRFVPVIRALDLTVGTPDFGRVFTIR